MLRRMLDVIKLVLQISTRSINEKEDSGSKTPADSTLKDKTPNLNAKKMTSRDSYRNIFLDRENRKNSNLIYFKIN